MKMKKMFWAVSLAMVLPMVAFPQCKELKWPENKSKAEECVAVFSDAIKQQNYREAVPSLRWMLANAPQWNLKLYVDAVEVYDKLAGKETDAAKKQVLVDSLMGLYDMRIKNCGDEPNVLNRKAFSSLKYNIQNKDKAAEVLAMYDKVYEISGTNIMESNLDGYMTAIQANFVLLKNLNDDQIFQRYDKIMEIIDAKIKKAQAENKADVVERLKKIKVSVDEKLSKLVKMDCERVKKILEPKFHANPADLNLAKKIFQFMTTGGCIEDPLWLEAAEAIHKSTPDYGLASNMAKLYLKKGNAEKADIFIAEAVTLASKPEQKADALIFQGDIQSQKGSKSAARETYRKALAADPNNKEGYEKIGDLYINSFSDCRQNKSIAEDRLIYIAAYEMYARSGNQQKMGQARSQFPSVTELFELNWKEGESKKIACWVGETVTLRTRGKE
jgi:tetratricopeptide (TPR) repeat protein